MLEQIPMIAWVGIAIMLVVIVGTVDTNLGGWLLLVVTMSMVYAAHEKNLL